MKFVECVETSSFLGLYKPLTPRLFPSNAELELMYPVKGNETKMKTNVGISYLMKSASSRELSSLSYEIRYERGHVKLQFRQSDFVEECQEDQFK